jgi:ketosteroid isomerase-like protein
MTSNRDRADVLTGALQALVDGDREALTRVLTHDVRVWAPEMATATRDELLAALDRRDDAFTDPVVDVVALDVGGDHACAEWVLDMRHTGRIELRDGTIVEPTELPIELHGVAVAEFDGDAICALRQYWNVNSLLEQLGETGRPTSEIAG